MPVVVVMGSCLANLPCLFLMSDYKWERPNNAAVLRSDYFVEQFIDRKGGVPSEAELLKRIRWKPGVEKEAERWLKECYRDTVGHLEIPAEAPGLFETLETRRIDLVLMDNLHDTHTRRLHNTPRDGEPGYSLPFSLSRCENEADLARDFYYSEPLTAAESVRNWMRIIHYVKKVQPHARIMFYAAHSCTSTDLPDRYARTREFHAMMQPLAAELGITLIPPFELPMDLTRMPQDRDHFDMRVYRAMAGQIFLDFNGLMRT